MQKGILLIIGLLFMLSAIRGLQTHSIMPIIYTISGLVIGALLARWNK